MEPEVERGCSDFSLGSEMEDQIASVIELVCMCWVVVCICRLEFIISYQGYLAFGMQQWEIYEDLW